MTRIEQRLGLAGQSTRFLIGAQELKQLIRLEDVIGQTYELSSSGRWLRLKDHDSCVIDTWNQRFYWNSRNLGGDVYDWLMALHNWDFTQAIAHVARLAGIDFTTTVPQLGPPPLKPGHPSRSRIMMPPLPAWRRKGREVVARAEANLWSKNGQKALVWLQQRGLTSATIKRARLGWTFQDRYDNPRQWGFKGGKPIYIAKGLVIPWFYRRQLWRIRIRRPDESGTDSHQSRYIGPRVYPATRHWRDHDLLYNSDTLKPGCPGILVEGEIDALTIVQSLGPNELGIGVVATGSVSGSRRPYWLAQLALCSTVLIAYDQDAAGETASQFWLEALAKAKRWTPASKDVNQMLQEGKDVWAWVRAGLADDAAGANP